MNLDIVWKNFLQKLSKVQAFKERILSLNSNKNIRDKD